MNEVFEAVNRLEFEAAGGSTGVVLRLMGSALKWISIGACFHAGWRIVGI